MPVMDVMDIGKVRVTKVPKKIPDTVSDPSKGKKRIKIDKDLFKFLWAIRHMKSGERVRILLKFSTGSFPVNV